MIEILERRNLLEVCPPPIQRLEIRLVAAICVLERGVAGPQGIHGAIAHHDYEEFVVSSDGQLEYTLSRAPVSADAVFINGLQQPRTEFGIVANKLLFNSGDGIIATDVIGISYFY